MSAKKRDHPETICTHQGRGHKPHTGFVNPPSTRGSTYLYPSLSEFRASGNERFNMGGIAYGRYGSQTTRELEKAMATLDGAYGAMITSSGFSAISTAILACVSAGDHILMIDTAYDPTRTFCEQTLKRLGIETTFYSPDLAQDIEPLIQDNTRAIFLESPGSLTFEVQDLKTIIEISNKHRLVSILDNTWATSIYYPAIAKGVNISIQSATKYIGGHSDLMMGIITTDEQYWPAVRNSYVEFGHSPATEETMLALRGLRTLPCRLRQHGESALKVAKWLESRAEVAAIHYPALHNDPYHKNFNEQFSGATGLFSFSLNTQDQQAIQHMVDPMALFSIGVSWGGYESLILPANPRKIRTAKPWALPGQLVRLSIGLEHPDDLIQDLDAGLTRLNEALRW